MRQHTPGPWLLENRGYKFIVSKPGDGYITRDVCRMDGSTMAAFEQEANSQLIAAAPDLLAALQELLHMPEFDGTPECSLLRRDAKRAARAAITKAGG